MQIIRRLMFVVALICPLIAQAEPQAAKQYQRELTRNSHAIGGLNAPVALFAAQIHQESQWNVTALSHVGAQGLAQFIPQIASWIASQYPELKTNQPFNPDWALRALVLYDYWLYQRIHAATDCDRWAFVLSAYNGGLGWVQRDKRKARIQGLDPMAYWHTVESVNAGRSRANFIENRGYPKRIIYRWQLRYMHWGNSVCLDD
ncbi:lytic transglycosylase domain-containing protein [[Haemophilus] ducreyi]|uniref:transglycosylase SLT domain-containing protein n=1 Tax=Haemophilus ducreyi TaxID=730 RepID=UPI000655C904|nr:lytic transglycosylase domain-containing protein [[Haemophilus] ducreyi]AKO45693.1 lytic transglycosylase [[Haemophilus] ducreyi]AKO47079.1 lytic transglycosylase [[Haemophilus] ducreyi]AKO48424.1 lytic transglycosylase [[Haemophilus] ducreyi]AKO49809.1 lytic transglycosylase [[Haemophilus] ducreyi]OOS03023.1 lytic transglycosylase [[Haemophilus] ducreyi]